MDYNEPLTVEHMQTQCNSITHTPLQTQHYFGVYSYLRRGHQTIFTLLANTILVY